MDDEGEQGSLIAIHAIKHQYRLHGKVPGTGAIGCGNQYGKRSDHEGHKRYAETQGILAEISVFDPEDTETRRKLNKYFSRFGYEPLNCGYRLGGAEADLLIKPIKGAAEIAPVADRVIRDFYSRVIGPTKFARMVEIRVK